MSSLMCSNSYTLGNIIGPIVNQKLNVNAEIPITL